MDKHQETIKQYSCQNENDVIGTKEAAKLLGISVQKLYSLVKNNAIPCSRQGRKIFFQKKDIATRKSLALPEGIIEVKREYYPDMERMIKALEILIRS